MPSCVPDAAGYSQESEPGELAGWIVGSAGGWPGGHGVASGAGVVAKNVTPREQLFRYAASDRDKQDVRDRLLCDIHEWMEECRCLWQGHEQAERGEDGPMPETMQ